MIDLIIGREYKSERLETASEVGPFFDSSHNRTVTACHEPAACKTVRLLIVVDNAVE